MKQFFTRKHSLFLVLLLCLAKLSSAQLPYIVKDIFKEGSASVNNLINANGILYFTAYDTNYEHGEELWRSDGTAAGTYIVKDINPGGGSSEITSIINVNGTLYFRARDEGGIHRLWKSNGTEQGTVAVSTAAISAGYITNINGTVYFTGNTSALGTELWRSDGTAIGTTLVKDINPGAFSSFINYLTNVNGTLYFRTAYNSTQSIWKSDGTESGTVLVKQFNTPYADITNLTDVNGTLFLTLDNQVHGKELWKSNGTPEGTVMVKDINPGGEGANIGSLVVMENLLYFSAYNSAYGQEMWQSDGTEEGTKLVKDISPGDVSSYLQLFFNSNGTLYFTIDDGINGRELWKSDGTPDGTLLVKDIYPGSVGSSILSMVNINGTIYFAANSGSYGPELWKSDGTTAGTVLVKNITPSSDYQNIDFMTNVNGKLYFMCSTIVDNTTYNATLWSLGTCTPANKMINTLEKTSPYNSQVQSSSTTTCYCNVFNELITTIDATGDTPMSGNIGIKEWRYSPMNTYYVPRQYELYPDTDPDNATAKVTLYYTQSDFDAYNEYPTNALKLPTDSSDSKGISSILIEKRGGTSSNDSGWPITYSGSMTQINPDDADIVWNSTAKRWEVSFETTGMGGYILKSVALTAPTAVSVSKTAICSNETISLSATCAEGTLNWYTSASGGSSIGTTSPLVVSPQITTTYYAACEYGVNTTNRVATQEVVVTTMPTAPTDISVNKTAICSGETIDLTATCLIGTVKWYTQLSGGSVISTASTLQQSPLETVSYYVACENGDCKTARVLVGAVVVTEQPTKPTGVSISETEACSSEYVSLSATCDIGTITWYKDEYDLTSVGTDNNWGEVPGITTTYYAACENGDCKSERVLVGTVTVTDQPVDPVDVSISQTAVCSGTSIDLYAYCYVGTATWYKIGEVEDILIGTGSILTQTPSDNAKYFVTCENGICVSGRVITDQVVVTTQPSNPTSVSVSKTEICSGQSITLSANCAIGTLKWYDSDNLSSSIGTGTNLAVTPPDEYNYYYAICVNGVCESESVYTSLIQVAQQPENPTNVSASDSVICSGVEISLTATCTIGSTVWYDSATSETSIGDGRPFYYSPTVTNTYFVACENGSCKSERVSAGEVTVRPTPDKPTNLSQWSTTVCPGGSVGLSGSCASGTLKWYESDTATTPVQAGWDVYVNPTRTITYYAACETTYCSSERVAMEEIVYYDRPVNPTGVAVSKTAVCNGESITLTGSCAIGSIKWIRAYTTGGVEQYDLIPTNTPTETSVYYAYCINGTCISDYLPTNEVVVTEQPSNPTDLFQGGTQICAGTGIYLNASCATGTLTWYDSSTGATVLGTGEFFIGRPTTTTTYYVACENGNCKSQRVAMNEIVVYQQTVNPTGVSVSKTAICNGETITLSGTCLIGTIHWYKTSMDPDTAFTYRPKVNTVYHATCTNEQCFSESVATAEVVVTQQPGNPTNVSVDKTTICKDESITLTATCSLGTITWYNSSTGNSIVGTGNNLSQTPTVNTKYYAACVNGICNSGRVVTSEVAVKAKPVTPVISGRNAICNGESVILMASAPANNPDATFHWSGGSTGISLITSPTTTTNYRAVATYNGCNSDSSAVFTVSVNRVPEQPGITADNATICKGGTVILTGQCSSIAESFYWSGSTTNTNSLQGAYYKNTRQITEPGTYKGWCESNTGCKGAEKSITITAGTNCGGKNFITITPAKAVVCPGSSVTLTAAGCTGTVSWLGGVSTLTGTAITVSPTANITYFAQCSAGGSATVDVTVATSAVAMSANITTGNELIKAVNSIESNKKIGDPDFSPAPVVTFEAGKSILLKPGFVADSKSVFTAQIKGCN